MSIFLLRAATIWSSIGGNTVRTAHVGDLIQEVCGVVYTLQKASNDIPLSPEPALSTGALRLGPILTLQLLGAWTSDGGAEHRQEGKSNDGRAHFDACDQLPSEDELQRMPVIL